ncbi:DEAD/DEAH box helicase family protein [Gracilibacillus sp. D59]|uniref:DEAD/DEAH box helicase family protein n=1 Tax=Gracilibacillus sp. D59 TaxID=3457434 RepID=UPI003FCD3E00
MIDFSKLNGDDSIDSVLDPREIFDILPEKDEKYEEYLRDVQTEVLNKWFNHYKNKKDVIIKMNTGSGKTVVGLLMLKSCLNEKMGPAVYVVPDPYLVRQVKSEAEALGISVTGNPADPSFRKGESILVINIFKLINGKSIFGVNEVEINLGSVIIDDAHACLDIAENQFSIKIPSQTDLYKEVLSIFRESIKQQSEIRLIELESGDPNANIAVPFWSWIDNKSDLLQLLHKNSDTSDTELNSLKFGWPLIKNNIELCNCVIGSDSIEISPKFLPIKSIPSFNFAKRRIFMSATLSDDSILSSHFDIDSDSISESITPNSSNDIGERMIIIPQELNPEITDDQLKKFYKYLSKEQNVVILVPSNHRSSYWIDVADRILNARNLQEGVAELKNGHVGLVVVVNKYDGIDLPKDACTVLVIDRLPDVRRKIDKIEEGILQGSDIIATNKIQKIEQGMGRGVRSKDDHCVVFLMGSTLVNHLYVMDAISKFTPATRKQIELSNQLSRQMRGSGLKEMYKVIKYSLDRDKNWISTARGALVKIKYNSEVKFDDKIISLRKAYNNALQGNYNEAVATILDLINNEDSLLVKGYLKQKAAEYYHFYDPVEAQHILKSAVKDNNQVIHPIEGIQYDKLLPGDVTQAVQLVNFMNNGNMNPNKYVLFVTKLIEQLIFQPNTSKIFEQAIMDLAFVLGFKGQRPENQFNKGPDDLWSVDVGKYYVIECKNGATSSKISKSDCNQLNGSITWFENNYDDSNIQTPIMIHKSNEFEYAASPNHNIRIINEPYLEKLKENLRKFSQAVTANYTDTLKVEELLNIFNFKPEKFIDEYTISFKK